MIQEFNNLFLSHHYQSSKNKKYSNKFVTGLIPLTSKTPINQDDIKEGFTGQSTQNENNTLEIKEAKLCFGSVKINDKVLLKVIIENKNM